MIHLSEVSKRFPGANHDAVHRVSFTASEAEILALVGASGSGKTTTLRLINRLAERTSGRIMIDGHDIANTDPVALRRGIGYVIQSIGLFPHFTIEENIAVVPSLLGWPKRVIRQRCEELLHLIGLPPEVFADRYPRQLSGGQRQRVGVARALAARPRIMLMDEPFGALDPVTRHALQQQLLSLRQSCGLTIVLVTHDMAEALILADTIAVMHEGKLIRIGSPRQLMTDPQHDTVRRLIDTPARHARAIERLAHQSKPDVRS